MNYNLNLLKKPLPFQPGTLTLWSNDYIGRNVLKRHLDGTVDSGTRKAETVIKTSAWLYYIKPETASILDVGCGPGLYAPLLCGYGMDYEGFDISPYQIAYAKQHNSVPGKTRFHISDFRTWNSWQTYDLILLLYDIYSFYCRSERVAFLKKIKNNLNSSGGIVVEVFTPLHYKNRSDTTDWEYIKQNGFWCSTPYLELNAFTKYDKSLILIQTAILNDRIELWNSWIQTFEAKDLIKELEEAGFTKFQLYGSCYGSPLTDQSEVLCVYAQAEE